MLCGAQLCCGNSNDHGYMKTAISVILNKNIISTTIFATFILKSRKMVKTLISEKFKTGTCVKHTCMMTTDTTVREIVGGGGGLWPLKSPDH